MKKVLRWFIYIFVALVAAAVALFFSIDPIAKSIAENTIRDQIGMETRIGRFDINLTRRSIHIEDFKLINPPEFGGGTFLSLPELYVELDTDKVRETEKLHLKSVRINLAELHIVEDKNGRRNVEQWEEPIKDMGGKGKRTPPEPSSTNQTSRSDFGSIERLEISLGRVHFTNERNASENFDRNLAITNRVFNDIKTEQQLKAIGVILAVQSGINIFQQSNTNSPGENPAKMLQDIFAPFKNLKN